MKIQNPGIALGPTKTPLNRRHNENNTLAMFEAVSAVAIPAIIRCANVLLNRINSSTNKNCVAPRETTASV